MKKLFLLGAMVCALGMMTANVSAQNVTESDIVGKWEFKEAQNFQSPNVGLYLHGEHAAVGETVFSLMRDIEFRPRRDSFGAGGCRPRPRRELYVLHLRGEMEYRHP